MSYILDALKKSEQARGSRKTLVLLEEPPRVPVASSQPPGRSLRWPHLIALILFLNTAFFVFWLRPWQRGGSMPRMPGEQLRAVTGAPSPESRASSGLSAQSGRGDSAAQQSAPVIPPQPSTQLQEEQEATKSQPVAKENPALNPPAHDGVTAASAGPPVTGTQTNETDQIAENKIPPKDQGATQGPTTGPTSADQAPAPLPATAPGVSSRVDVGVKKPDGSKPPQDPRAAGTKKGLKTANLETARKKPAVRAEQPPQPAAGSGIVSDLQPLTEIDSSSAKPAVHREPKWHELAPQIRDAIPNMSISMLIYSKKPRDRWININGSKKREGEEISAGLKVEEITPDGAIFSYQGHRFHKGVVGD